MTHLVAKVPLDELRQFLKEHGEYWTTDGLSDDEGNPQSPAELVGALAWVRPELGYVYIFNPTESPDEIANKVDWQAIPTIVAAELPSFIIRTVQGSDFLWVAPSDEHLSNGEYVTILPVEPIVEGSEPTSHDYLRAITPRLTRISIENFKGIQDQVAFDLRPITLLFGANSAGKSSLIHSLHYAREIFERRNLNADRTLSGENLLDLGGFASFVHGHDRQSEIRLGFDIDIGFETLLPFSGTTTTSYSSDEAQPLYKDVKSARIELSVAWSELLGCAHTTRFAVRLNGQPFAEITSRPGAPDVFLALDTQHPVFVRARENETIWRWHPLEPDQVSETESAFDSILGWAAHIRAFDTFSPTESPYSVALGLTQIGDALPNLSQRLHFSSGPDRSPGPPEMSYHEEAAMEEFLASTVSELVIGPVLVLRRLLSEMRYIGPLRQVPPRNFSRPRFRETNRWVNGTAAWNLLMEGDEELVERVQSWVSDSDKLNLGYQVEPKHFKEFSKEKVSRIEILLKRLEDDSDVENLRELLLEELSEPSWLTRLSLYDAANNLEVEPQDVGVGVSQVLPVVVAVLDAYQGITAIEQPELHLHQAVQVALGDLLIAGIRIVPRMLLVETHSEHLLLRLLRRIRESHDGELPPEHTGLNPDDIAVMYVESVAGQVQVTPLQIDETGEFRDRWPQGFFEERAAELF